MFNAFEVSVSSPTQPTSLVLVGGFVYYDRTQHLQKQCDGLQSHSEIMVWNKVKDEGKMKNRCHQSGHQLQYEIKTSFKVRVCNGCVAELHNITNSKAINIQPVYNYQAPPLAVCNSMSY